MNLHWGENLNSDMPFKSVEVILMFVLLESDILCEFKRHIMYYSFYDAKRSS
jgi:hypothetical protein